MVIERHIARPAIIWTLEKGEWPAIDHICAQIGKLAKDDVLSNQEFLAVAAEHGGFGHPSYPDSEGEFYWFKRDLANADLPTVLKAIESPPDGVQLEPSYNDVLMMVHPPSADQYDSPYWSLRILRSLRLIMPMTLIEPRTWPDVLPPADREWALSEIGGATIRYGNGSEEANRQLRRFKALARFHATPEAREQFGLDTGQERPLTELLSCQARQMTFRELGPERLAFAFSDRPQEEQAKVREHVESFALAKYDLAMRTPPDARALEVAGWIDPADARQQLYALIDYHTLALA